MGTPKRRISILVDRDLWEQIIIYAAEHTATITEAIHRLCGHGLVLLASLEGEQQRPVPTKRRLLQLSIRLKTVERRLLILEQKRGD